MLVYFKLKPFNTKGLGVFTVFSKIVNCHLIKLGSKLIFIDGNPLSIRNFTPLIKQWATCNETRKFLNL